MMLLKCPKIVKKIPHAVCQLCMQNGPSSGMISCDASYCKVRFHVRCAIKKGLIVDWKKMNQRSMKIYCPKHLVNHPDWEPIREKREVKATKKSSEKPIANTATEFDKKLLSKVVAAVTASK